MQNAFRLVPIFSPTEYSDLICKDEEQEKEKEQVWSMVDVKSPATSFSLLPYFHAWQHVISSCLSSSFASSLFLQYSYQHNVVVFYANEIQQHHNEEKQEEDKKQEEQDEMTTQKYCMLIEQMHEQFVYLHENHNLVYVGLSPEHVICVNNGLYLLVSNQHCFENGVVTTLGYRRNMPYFANPSILSMTTIPSEPMEMATTTFYSFCLMLLWFLQDKTQYSPRDIRTRRDVIALLDTSCASFPKLYACLLRYFTKGVFLFI